MSIINTGSEVINLLLNGGLRVHTITNIFGASATGKTQLCFQLSANVAKDNHKVYYIDTLNNFRPERIIDVLDDKDNKALDNIYVIKPLGVYDAIRVINNIDNAKALIIDDISELFLDRESVIKDIILFMHKLLLIALKYDIAIMFTNKITFNYQQKFDKFVSRFIHYKVMLSKYNDIFIAKLLHPNEDIVYYKISRKGLEII
jgi:RecA/RadA recombinase